MPVSKLAFLRYLLIDRMLKDKMKTHPSKEELLVACRDEYGVRSVSTIEKDLKAMRLEFDAPILYSKKFNGYFYEDESFQLISASSRLTDENLLALGFVEELLEEFRDMPIFGEFSDAVDKVLDGLEITRKFNDDKKSVGKFIKFDKSPYNKGSDILSRLIESITEQKVISFDYKKFNSETPKNYILHPYLLKEFNNLWYLIGYIEDYKEVRTFGIDRIEDFWRLSQSIIAPQKVGFNSESFFSNCYGITALDGKSEEIILSFSPLQGNYIKTQPIHSSQKIITDNQNEFRISLDLVNNYELREKILSFGKNVEIISPNKLKQQLITEYKEVLQKYENGKLKMES